MPRYRKAVARSGSRRRRMWVMADNLPAGAGIVAGIAGNWGTAQAFDLLSAGETEIGHNFYEITVVRIRGHVWLEALSTLETDYALAAGIAFLPDTAMTAGDMPNPGDDGYDWIWHDYGFIRIAEEFTPAAPLHPVELPTMHLVIDNKAMRKMNDNSFNLALVVATTTVQAQTPVMNFAIRTLVLLP